MGERRRLVWETYGDLGITRSREVTTLEKVLAEMDTEVLVEELRRRGFTPITDEASFVEWLRSMKEGG